jgi:glycosyltransferase involved in cell wall biosynthesis
MKIGFFLDQSFPPDSRVENEAYSLIKAGHEVHLFSLDYENRKPAKEEINGIHVYRYSAGKLTYKLSALAYTNGWFKGLISKKIKAFIEAVKPDVLHVHDMVIAESVMDVNDSDYNKPLVLDLHENRPEIMQFYPHLKKFPGKQLIRIGKWRKKQSELIKRADHVILVTKEAIKVAAFETNLPMGKFTDVANTVEPDIYWNYALDKEIILKFKKGFDIVYVGDTGLRRGTDTAIDAIKLLINKIPEIQLVLVGKSTEDEILKRKVFELGLTSNVLFEGWKDVSNFPSYIEGAEVCISPLHRNKHHDTTFANKLFQYMAGERAVIVSNCDAQANVVKETDCGLVFEAGNAKALADCLLDLYKNPHRAKEYGMNGKKAVVDKYNWKETSKGLIALYEGL